MKCLYCGNESDGYLCLDCRTSEIIEKIYYQIMYYDTQKNQATPFVNEYEQHFENYKDARSVIVDLLDLFPDEMVAYYRCMYSRATNDDDFENLAISYIETHDFLEKRTQRVMSCTENRLNRGS